MSSKPRCTLIVDHLAESRVTMARLLAQVQPSLPVCEAGTLAQAESLVLSHSVELALIDFTLPDGSALDALRLLHAAQPEARAVIITLWDDDEHVFPALQAGAFGYVLKNRPEIELVAQLRRIRDGEPPLSSSVARRMLKHFAAVSEHFPLPAAPAAPPPGLVPVQPLRPGMVEEPEVALTERETEVLQRVGKGYTLPEIAQQLALSRHTVADYVKQIYRKLDISSRAEAALEAARRGLVR
ncbi:MAG: response regulator transcription factor [Betaproteobacteria bacterium]|jgi:DNA-binding NarL/FixJ family response regulator|nr:response regulator transcription factor [Betaproteobacteria bacterium]MDE2151643.1 response regulator transcription factor [Betaproteobacteria bacterium]MDE2477391.1 response regulator transcription factor [Betaproteobacteria bacterium]